MPLAGLTAYQALFTKAGRTFTGDDLGNLKPTQKLLVIGGATLVGSFAVQLAKNVGAIVACTASAKNNAQGVAKTEACKALGADVVIDYGQDEWSDVLAGQEYDLVFDTIGKQEDWANAAKVLKKGGDFISVANFAADPAANECERLQELPAQERRRGSTRPGRDGQGWEADRARGLSRALRGRPGGARQEPRAGQRGENRGRRRTRVRLLPPRFLGGDSCVPTFEVEVPSS